MATGKVTLAAVGDIGRVGVMTNDADLGFPTAVIAMHGEIAMTGVALGRYIDDIFISGYLKNSTHQIDSLNLLSKVIDTY